MIFSTALKRIGGNVSMRRMSWPRGMHVAFFEKDEQTLGLMMHFDNRKREYEASVEDLNAIDWNILQEVQ